MYMYSSRRRHPSEKNTPPLTRGRPCKLQTPSGGPDLSLLPPFRSSPDTGPCPALPEREQSWDTSSPWSARRDRSWTASSTLGRGVSGLRHCGSTGNTLWNLKHRGPEGRDPSNPTRNSLSLSLPGTGNSGRPDEEGTWLRQAWVQMPASCHPLLQELVGTAFACRGLEMADAPLAQCHLVSGGRPRRPGVPASTRLPGKYGGRLGAAGRNVPRARPTDWPGSGSDRQTGLWLAA